ncbi:hypothetical protein VCHA34P112_80052 [Vibrio chagasii]|nr:hypothetical protein VCHA34P112_80052 [Vibrio chagasii]CAH7423450.1 hypothetical protein VCHA56P515_80147 [Vibrio chagasii]CAH7455183.1 hypothetical protein VCHA53O463_90134 [Vibrio chagasii]
MSTIRCEHNYTYLNFGGISEPDTNMQRVKLVNLAGFTPDDIGITGWVDIGSEYYCVGVYLHNTYKVILRDGLPVTFPLEGN